MLVIVDIERMFELVVILMEKRQQHEHDVRV